MPYLPFRLKESSPSKRGLFSRTKRVPPMKPRQEGKPLSLLIRRLISCLSSSSGQPTACFSNDRIARMHRSVYSSTAPSLENEKKKKKNEKNTPMEVPGIHVRPVCPRM